jgi:hypothetical protein
LDSYEAFIEIDIESPEKSIWDPYRNPIEYIPADSHSKAVRNHVNLYNTSFGNLL